MAGGGGGAVSAGCGVEACAADAGQACAVAGVFAAAGGHFGGSGVDAAVDGSVEAGEDGQQGTTGRGSAVDCGSTSSSKEKAMIAVTFYSAITFVGADMGFWEGFYFACFVAGTPAGLPI